MSKPLIETNWTEHSCDVCGSENYSSLGQREYKVSGRTMDFRMRFEDVCCDQCAFVYEKKRPDEEFLFDFYRDAHNRYDSHIDIRVDYDIEARLNPIRTYVEGGAKILEVGASTGHFCQSLCDAGYKAEGLDPLDQDNDDADVQKGFITENKDLPTSEKYDAIVSYYVLEHVRDANEWIGQLSSMLKDGGYIFIEVPDYKNYPYNSLTFEHMFHFRQEHAELLFKKHGFKVVREPAYKASRYFGFVTVAQKIGNEVEEISPEYDVQELKSEAVSLYGRSKEIEEERQALAQHVSENINVALQQDSESTIYFWGANDYATNTVSKLKIEDQSVFLLDNSETKVGTFHEGFSKAIIRPDAQNIADNAIFVLCSPNWNDDIAEQIESFGLSSYKLISGITVE